MTPCLWYDSQAEETVRFYASVMKKVKTGKVARYDAESAKVSERPEGSRRAMEAMLKMTRIVIADLEKAYKG
ncbi:MAG: VOC family protein [Chrysiogenales bacterium]